MLLTDKTEKLTPTKGTINSMKTYLKNAGTYDFMSAYFRFVTTTGKVTLTKIPIQNEKLLNTIIENQQSQFIFNLIEVDNTPMVESIEQIITN